MRRPRRGDRIPVVAAGPFRVGRTSDAARDAYVGKALEFAGRIPRVAQT